MSSIFSEESKFLVSRWQTVEKLDKDIQTLRYEFTQYLDSVRKILKKRNWWGDDLIFEQYRQEGIYIARKSWFIRKNDRYPAIWIGVEEFKPESMFGLGEPADCYLWVFGKMLGKKADTVRNDLTRISEKNRGLKKYIYGKENNQFLYKPLPKYFNREYKAFIAGEPLRDAADFIERTYLAIRKYKIKK